MKEGRKYGYKPLSPLGSIQMRVRWEYGYLGSSKWNNAQYKDKEVNTMTLFNSVFC